MASTRTTKRNNARIRLALLRLYEINRTRFWDLHQITTSLHLIEFTGITQMQLRRRLDDLLQLEHVETQRLQRRGSATGYRITALGMAQSPDDASEAA